MLSYRERKEKTSMKKQINMQEINQKTTNARIYYLKKKVRKKKEEENFYHYVRVSE